MLGSGVYASHTYDKAYYHGKKVLGNHLLYSSCWSMWARCTGIRAKRLGGRLHYMTKPRDTLICKSFYIYFSTELKSRGMSSKNLGRRTTPAPGSSLMSAEHSRLRDCRWDEGRYCYGGCTNYSLNMYYSSKENCIKSPEHIHILGVCYTAGNTYHCMMRTSPSSCSKEIHYYSNIRLTYVKLHLAPPNWE